MIRYAEHIGENTPFYQIQDKEQILGFLDSERKTDKQIEEQIAENPAHPWIRVMKERLRYKFRSKDDLLLPVLNKGVPDRSIEITTLNLVNN